MVKLVAPNKADVLLLAVEYVLSGVSFKADTPRMVFWFTAFILVKRGFKYLVRRDLCAQLVLFFVFPDREASLAVKFKEPLWVECSLKHLALGDELQHVTSCKNAL